MNHRMSNVVLVHDLKVVYKDGILMYMENFSRFRFMSLYLRKNFTSSVKFHHLDGSEAYYNLQDCIDDVVDYINKNGGFTIIGWYKRGEIHDQSNEIVSSEVESSELGYHIVSINPKVSDVTDHDECIEKN